MKNLIVCFTGLVVGIYWLITIVFVLPDNYVNVSYSKFFRAFDTYMFQRWAFFAPPPKYNEKLYYAFFDADNKIHVYEIFEPLDRDKQQNAPFNKKEEVLDYILHNSTTSMSNISVDLQNMINYDIKNSKSDTSKVSNLQSTKTKVLIAGLEESNEFKTLCNYGRVVARLNHLHATSFRIRIAKVNIKKFIDQDSKKAENEEITFQSDLYKL